MTPPEKQKELLKEEILSGRVKDETTLAVFTMVQELKEDIEELRGEVDKAIDKVKESEIDLPKVLESVRGKDGKDGEKGEMGEKPKLGVDYFIPENGNDGYTPVKGKDYFDGATGKDGKDGETIVGPAGINGKDGSPDSPEQTRDKLESIKEGEKLSIQAIQDLPKLLEEIKGNVTNVSGRVATSLISKRIRFIDDLTPTGTVDGANAIFTISKSPETGSLKVYVNGQRMRVTEDYTLSNGDRTITFIIAPPSTSIILVDFRY